MVKQGKGIGLVTIHNLTSKNPLDMQKTTPMVRFVRLQILEKDKAMATVYANAAGEGGYERSGLA